MALRGTLCSGRTSRRAAAFVLMCATLPGLAAAAGLSKAEADVEAAESKALHHACMCMAAVLPCASVPLVVPPASTPCSCGLRPCAVQGLPCSASATPPLSGSSWCSRKGPGACQAGTKPRRSTTVTGAASLAAASSNRALSPRCWTRGSKPCVQSGWNSSHRLCQ